jgi:hypothetical protein
VVVTGAWLGVVNARVEVTVVAATVVVRGTAVVGDADDVVIVVVAVVGRAVVVVTVAPTADATWPVVVTGMVTPPGTLGASVRASGTMFAPCVGP